MTVANMLCCVIKPHSQKALNLTSAQPIASRTYFDPQSEPGEQIERTRVRIQGNKEWFQACDW